MSSLLRLSRQWQFLRLPLFLMILKFQIFYRMPFSLGLTDSFWFLGKEDLCRGKVPFLQHQIKSISYQCNWSLLTLTLTPLRQCCQISPLLSDSLFPFSILRYLEGHHLHSAHLGSGELFYLLECKVSMWIIWKSSVWKLYLFSTIYLFMQSLFIEYGLMGIGSISWIII